MDTKLHILLLLVFLLSTLSACSSDQPPSPTPTRSAKPTATTGLKQTATPLIASSATPAASITPTPGLDLSKLKGLKISFWHPWNGSLADRVQELMNDFNSSNQWGIQVTVRTLYGSQTLADAVETAKDGSGPQVVVAPPDQLEYWLEQGQGVNLKPYLENMSLNQADGGSVGDIEKNILQVFWQQEISGIQESNSGVRQSGIPALRSARVVFYNSTWAQELGFPKAPSTPDEFKAQACAAAAVNAKAYQVDLHGTGGYLVDHDSLTFLSWLHAFGSNPIPQQEGQPYTFHTQEGSDAINFLRKMADDGCAWEGRNPAPQEYFTKRMALFYTGSLVDLEVQKAAQERAQSKDQWTILPFTTKDGKLFIFSSGYSYGILKSSPEAQTAAWLLIRWLSSTHNQAQLADAGQMLPVGKAAVQEFTDYTQKYPWLLILPLQEIALPGPGLGSWHKVQSLLEDAAWQVFRLPADQSGYILPQLDDMSKELIERK